MTHHILHGVDHRPRAKEQHRFEEGMGHQVEHASNGSAATHGQHHVAQLRHSAVGKPLFEIHLGQSDRGA